MTEEIIEKFAEEYAERVIKHKMAVHNVFDKEQVMTELKSAFKEGAVFTYYSNNKELKEEN